MLFYFATLSGRVVIRFACEISFSGHRELGLGITNVPMFAPQKGDTDAGGLGLGRPADPAEPAVAEKPPI